MMNIRAIIDHICPPCLKPSWGRLRASALGTRLASGYFWVTVGTGVSKGLAMVSYMAVARILGKIGFGEFGIIQTTVGMFGVFAGAGMGITATKYVAEYRTKNPSMLGAILSLSLISTLIVASVAAMVCYIIAPWVTSSILNAPHLSNILRLGSLFMVFAAMNGTLTGALRGFEAYRSLSKTLFFAGIITFPLVVGGAWGWSLKGSILGLVVGQVAMAVLLWSDLLYRIRQSGNTLVLKNWWREWRALYRFSLPVFLSGIMVVPVTWICSALLVNQPGGYAQNGVFTAVNQWFVLLLFLPDKLSQVNLPVIVDHVSRKDYRKAYRIVFLFLKINAAITIPLALILGPFSPYIMSLYGEGFAEEWLCLVVVLFTAVLTGAVKALSQVLVGAGKVYWLLGASASWGATFIVLSFYWTRFGAIGMVAARAIAYLLLLAILGIFFYRIFQNHSYAEAIDAEPNV